MVGQVDKNVDMRYLYFLVLLLVGGCEVSRPGLNLSGDIQEVCGGFQWARLLIDVDSFERYPLDSFALVRYRPGCDTVRPRCVSVIPVLNGSDVSAEVACCGLRLEFRTLGPRLLRMVVHGGSPRMAHVAIARAVSLGYIGGDVQETAKLDGGDVYVFGTSYSHDRVVDILTQILYQMCTNQKSAGGGR